MPLCDYGCGQEAKYQFKNGKGCCNSHWNRCPVIKDKLREAAIKQFKEQVHCQKGKTYEQMYGPEKAKELLENMSEIKMGNTNMLNKHHSKKSRKQMRESHRRIILNITILLYVLPVMGK